MENPKVMMETSHGEILIELYPEAAPVTVENFLSYVDEGFYAGTIFHRVIGNFMIQGGGMTPDMQEKPSRGPIVNEASDKVKNEIGTISMARTMEPDSATSQFFINVADNHFLNHRNKTPEGFGYAAFGKVVQGMDVVDKIKAVKTGNYGPYGDVPVERVEIISLRRHEA